MAVITFEVIFHGDANKPNMCLFVQYSHHWETKQRAFKLLLTVAQHELAIALINKKI